MPNLLLFAYFYPPLGGPGVQRPVKLVKYLKKFGWNTDVITVKDIVFHSYDEELVKEDMSENLFKAPSIDPMSILKKVGGKTKSTKNVYFGTPEKIKRIIRNSFPIDDKIGWYPGAWKIAKQQVKTKKYDAVMATMGPYTSGLLAYKVSKKYDIPLIIDYRDHWTLNPYSQYSSRLLQNNAEKWEKRILEKACLISTIGNVMKDELIQKFGSQLINKIHVMYNGYDEEDFKKIPKAENKELIIRYIGNFYGHRTPKYFIKALENLNNKGKLPRDILIEFVGNYDKENRKLIEDNSVSNFISIREQVDHKKAIKLLMNCDALLLFISSSTSKGILTGKIFEYLRSGKPIMAMVPIDGNAAGLLIEQDQNYISTMEDIAAIEKDFLDLYKSLKAKTIVSTSVSAIFSRENQTRDFINFLESRI